MNFRRIVGLLAASTLVLASCSSSGSGGDGDVTLEVWVFEGEESFFPTLKKRFEAEHPNVTIEITEIPEDSYTTKVDTALAAGSPPDLGLVFEPRWLQAGAVLPLDDVIESNDIDLSGFNQNALSGCTFEDNVYCLGSYVGSVLLFYNKDLFDAAGVPYPSPTEPMTIDEFADTAAQLSQPSSDLNERVWGTIGEAPFWWSDPVTHFSEDGRTIAGFVNDAPTAHLYDVMSSVVRDGHAPTGSEFELLGGVDLLSTGQVGMAISDNLVAIEALEAAGINWGAAPVPVETEGAPVYVSAWTDQVGVFSRTDSPEEAKEFVAFVATVGNELRIDVADQYPLNSSIQGADKWTKGSEGRAEFVQVISQAREAVFVPGFWDVTAPIWDSYDAMVAGDVSAQEGLDDLAPIMQESLDEAWETWEEVQQ